MAPRADTLPPEITAAIFEHLPDATSLSNASLVCRSFHEVIDGRHERFLRQMAITGFNNCLWGRAMAVHDATTVEEGALTQALLDDFIERCRGPSSVTPQELPLAALIDVLDLNRSVSYWTEQFFDYASRNLPTCFKLSPDHKDGEPMKIVPSPTEVLRVKQAFYRFELLAVVSRIAMTRRVWMPFNHQLQVLSFTEHEQLLVVYDFLKYTYASDTTSSHSSDIAWALWALECWEDNIWQILDGILSLGLRSIEQASQAFHTSRYEEEDEILEDPNDIGSNMVFLRRYDDVDMWHSTSQERSTEQDLQGGPDEATLWLRRHLERDGGRHLDDARRVLAVFRQWGYCVWDMERSRGWPYYLETSETGPIEATMPCKEPDVEHKELWASFRSSLPGVLQGYGGFLRNTLLK